MPEKAILPSLVGTVGPLLTEATTTQENLLRNSSWIPREWLKTCVFLLDDQTVSPMNPVRWNGEVQWELVKFSTLIEDISLQVTLPPTVTTGPNNAPSYYVNELGFAMIEAVQLVFGSNQAFNLQPYELYIKKRNNLTREKLEQINELMYGDSTTAERTVLLTNGTGANPMIVPLWLPFSDDPTQAYPLVVLSQKTRINLKLDSLQNLTHVATGNTIAQTGEVTLNLNVSCVYTTGDESNLFLAMAQSNDGLTYMIHQGVRQNSDDAASTASNYVFTAKLSAISKPLNTLWFGFVPVKLLDNTGRNNKFFFKPNPPPPVPPGMSPYNPILSFRMDTNGLIIQREVTRNYVRLYKHQKYFPSPGGDELFFQPYSLQPTATNVALGYLDYTNLNNPTLTVNFGQGGTGVDPDDPLLPQKLRLIVIGFDYNFWFFKSGNLARAFN